MKLKLIVSGVGTVMLIFPVSLLLPFFVGLLYKENILLLVESYVLPGLLCLSLGILLTSWAGRADKLTEDLRPMEALVIVNLIWVVIPIIGSLPFILMGTLPLFEDAFFESMSGFSTTGASVITEIDGLEHSILFWRSLTQWLGGLGVIVLMVAVFSVLLGGPKAGMLLMKGEVPGHKNDRVVPRFEGYGKTPLDDIRVADSYRSGAACTGGDDSIRCGLPYIHNPFHRRIRDPHCKYSILQGPPHGPTHRDHSCGVHDTGFC